MPACCRAGLMLLPWVPCRLLPVLFGPVTKERAGSTVLHSRLLSCRADAAALGSLSRALGSKLLPADAPQDVLAGVWALAQLNAKPDSALLSKAAAGIKGAVAELSIEQQICAAWSFALLGQVGGALDLNNAFLELYMFGWRC